MLAAVADDEDEDEDEEVDESVLAQPAATATLTADRPLNSHRRDTVRLGRGAFVVMAEGCGDSTVAGCLPAVRLL